MSHPERRLCSRGHDNWVAAAGGHGRRRCLTCKTEWSQENWRRYQPENPERKRVPPEVCKRGHTNWEIVGSGKRGPVRQCKTCKVDGVRFKWSGVTPQQYHDLRNAQAGCCALCLKMTYTLCADHNHVTGFIRGLLCLNCNRGLGLLKDSPVVLQRAAKYAARGD